MTLKAYRTWDGPDPEWVLLVFAGTANKARVVYLASDMSDFSGDALYTDIRARRLPAYDRYAKGDDPYAVLTNSDLPPEAPPYYSDHRDDW